MNFKNTTNHNESKRQRGARYLKQVVNEACNYPMNFKISMIPPLKLTKMIDEKEQHGEVHVKP